MNSEELQSAYAEASSRVDAILARRDSKHRAKVEGVIKPNSYKMVKEFHETFGHPVAEDPTIIDNGRSALRLELILEEVIELVEASGYDGSELRKAADSLVPVQGADIVGIADALGDVEYVVNGAALEHGIDLPKVVQEIHRSNMTKLGPDGKPIYRADGKILKGEGYEPPNIEAVLGL